METNNNEITKVWHVCAEMKAEGWGGGAPFEGILNRSQLKESVVLDALRQLDYFVYTEKGTILVDVSGA